jgi:hypothetical protein
LKRAGQALGKGVITTAYKGTQLPFDIFDVPTLYWNSQRALREELDKRRLFERHRMHRHQF